MRFFNCFFYICAYNISLVHVDVGPERLVGMSPIAKHVACPIDAITPYQEGRNNEKEIARNLEGLTRGIPDYARVGDISSQYQRHSVGVLD